MEASEQSLRLSNIDLKLHHDISSQNIKYRQTNDAAKTEHKLGVSFRAVSDSHFSLLLTVSLRLLYLFKCQNYSTIRHVILLIYVQHTHSYFNFDHGDKRI